MFPAAGPARGVSFKPQKSPVYLKISPGACLEQFDGLTTEARRRISPGASLLLTSPREDVKYPLDYPETGGYRKEEVGLFVRSPAPVILADGARYEEDKLREMQ